MFDACPSFVSENRLSLISCSEIFIQLCTLLPRRDMVNILVSSVISKCSVMRYFAWSLLEDFKAVSGFGEWGSVVTD